MKKFLSSILFSILILFYVSPVGAHSCDQLLEWIASKPLSKLFWLDLETGGLDETKQPIIELGAIVTDPSLVELDRFHRVIYQPEDVIRRFEPAAFEMHRQSGLLDLIARGRPLPEVQRHLLQFIDLNFERQDPVILTGNSPHFDRGFLKTYMPEIHRRLFYRHFDVSSLKIAFQLLYQREPAKPLPHFSLRDLDLSIRELRTYLEIIRKAPQP